jgi:hypothetical protein
MAKEPAKPDKKQLETEANDRLGEARKQKIQTELDLREGYFFAAPARSRNVLSTVPPAAVKPQDAAELNSSFAFEMCDDFPTAIINTFFPQGQPWVVSEPSVNLSGKDADVVATKAMAVDATVLKAINGSNLYEACGQGFNPDLALGVTGMWIDRRRLIDPIHCQPIPIRELEINMGPFGGIDDRFVVRYTRNRHIPALLKGITLPDKLSKHIKDKPNERGQVRWGFWRLWDEDDETWQHVVMVNDELVHDARLVGDGCCPLVIGRFGPSPDWAWSAGPLIKALPDLRYNDALAEGKIRNIELSLNPPIGWPDDSFTNIEEGIEPGMAYSLRAGTEGAVKRIYEPNPADPAIYEVLDLQQRIKRLFFLDTPEQPGKTPPTATQWLDQMVMAQRRIGTPGYTFWSEFCAGVYKRYRYLLAKAGKIEPIMVNGHVVSLTPYNPAQRAADQQDVAQAARAIEIGGQAFPEEFKMAVDGTTTLKNIVKKLGAEKIIIVRNPDDVHAAVGQIAQLIGGQQPGAPALPGPGGDVPPPQAGGAAPEAPTMAIQNRNDVRQT